MSREIKRRLIIEGRLVCKTPVHVGGLESLSSADLALALDGDGRPYAPGTSVTGPLRT